VQKLNCFYNHPQVHLFAQNNISDTTEGNAVHRYRLIGLPVLVVCLGSLPAHGAQNDQLPTDLVALPNGAVNVALYASQQSLSGPWMGGAKLRPGEGSTDLSVLRLNRHFSLGEGDKYTIAPVIVLSAVNAEVDRTLAPLPLKGLQASGMGDVRLGAAFWFHKDDTLREYAAVSAFVSLPTGDYDSARTINPGENRTKIILSAGWMQQLGRQWVLDLIPEVAIFGDNTRYQTNRRLSQDTAYAMTGVLRYKATPTLHWYGSAQLNRGGGTQVDGIQRAGGGAPENTRLSVGTILFGSNNNMLQLRYSRDVQIENGYRNQGQVGIRWSTVFN